MKKRKKEIISEREASKNQELLPTEEDRRMERKSEEDSIIDPDIKTVTRIEIMEKEKLIEGLKSKIIKKTGSLCKDEER